jgi:Asp-tRNA(Asn)/Glu-tRNA(Gln) amidotransferase C subunit
LDSIALSEIEPLHSKKEFSELRKDHAEPFGGDVLIPANKTKDGFVKGPRMV